MIHSTTGRDERPSIPHILFRAPALLAALTLVGASAACNAIFGASFGSNKFDVAVLVSVSIAADVLKSSSPVILRGALLRLDLPTAAACVLVIGITGTYSAVAAVGFAANIRDETAGSRASVIASRERAQEAYDQASVEIATLRPARPVETLTALINGVLIDPRSEGCTTINGAFTRQHCPRVAEWRAELARSQRAEKLRGEMALARATLDVPEAMQGRNVDPQVSALAALAILVGASVESDDLSTGLVLIAALLIEAGSLLGVMVATGPARGAFLLETPTLPVAYFYSGALA